MTADPTTMTKRSGRPAVALFWILATLAGLGLRLALLPLSPEWGYMPDHDDFVRWGIQATDEGVLTLYDKPPERHFLNVKDGDEWVIRQRNLDRLCNYPPAAVYLLYGSGALFKAVSDDERLINTTTSRAVFAIWSILADFILAAGCAAVVALYRSGWTARLTYLIVLLLPPLWWDSVVWGQVDSWVLAPAVWMLRAMITRRWIVAGVLFGLMAALKTQAILFLPLWGLAIVTTRQFRRPLIGVGVAAVTLIVISLPFDLHSGLTWFEKSYTANFGEYKSFTTLKAFNIWYVDALIHDSTNAERALLGVDRLQWGFSLLLVAMAASFALFWRRYRGDARGLLLWAPLSLVLMVMLPTQVHDRYLILALPFLVIVAMLQPRFWPGLALLTLVAMTQVTWPRWQLSDVGAWERYRAAQMQDVPADAEPPAGFSRMLFNTRVRIHRNRERTVALEWLACIMALCGAAGVVRAGLSRDALAEQSPIPSDPVLIG